MMAVVKARWLPVLLTTLLPPALPSTNWPVFFEHLGKVRTVSLLTMKNFVRFTPSTTSGS